MFVRIVWQIGCVILALNAGFAQTTPTDRWGSFPTEFRFSSPSGPAGIAVGDFNHDGKLDMAVVNSSAFSVSIYLGTGDGKFQTPITYPTGNYPVAIAVADFDHDGNLDVVVVNNNLQHFTDGDTVSIFLGNGDGSLKPAVTYTVGHRSNSVAVGDFNGDGILDLAVASTDDGTVSILQGQGNGTFAARVTYAAGDSPRSVVAVDLNGDSKMDLAVSSCYIAPNDLFGCSTISNPQGFVRTLLNHGNGTFEAPVSYAVSPYPGTLVVADLNGDGKHDLISSSILMNNGDGSFRSTGVSPISRAGSLIAADLDGDGIIDLVTGNGSYFSVSRGIGDGSFSPGVSLGLGINGGGTFAVGDFNGDSHLDLAMSSGQESVSVFLNSKAQGEDGVTVELSADHNPDAPGGHAIITVTVTKQGSNANGKVMLTLDGIPVLGGLGTLVNGSASYEISLPLETVTHSVDATFLDTDTLTTTSAPTLQLVAAPIPTQVTLETSGEFTLPGQQTTISVLVIPAFNAHVGIYGNVTFYDGNTVIGTAPLDYRNVFAYDSNNTFLQITLPAGMHTITAKYEGSASFQPSSTTAAYGVGAPQFSANTFTFQPEVVHRATPPLTVTVDNTTGPDLTTIFVDNPAFAVVNDCGQTIPSGSVCHLQVTFTPQQIGSTDMMATLITAVGQRSFQLFFSGDGLDIPVGAPRPGRSLRLSGNGQANSSSRATRVR